MSPTPSRLQALLIELEAALSAAGIRHAIVGGIAMAAHGRVRATEDIDLLVDLLQMDAMREVMRALGFEEEVHGAVASRYVRHPIKDLPEVAEWVDALYASRPTGRRLIERAAANPVALAGSSLPVVDAAGLILMKSLALAADPSRTTDADDIRFLISAGAGRIDLASLKRDAAEVGADVAATLDAVLALGAREAQPVSPRSRL